jgi:hypothetical protein
MSVTELGERLGGWGRGRIAWDCYSQGIDPYLYFTGQERTESVDAIQALLPRTRQTQTFGNQTLQLLHELNGGMTVEGGIATLVLVSKSKDDTTKLLLKLHDGYQIETVLIPWRGKRTTVCIQFSSGMSTGMYLLCDWSYGQSPKSDQ